MCIRDSANAGFSASQPTFMQTRLPPQNSSNVRSAGWPSASQAVMDRFMADPALSQFSQQPSVPMTVTQQARHFRDIVPEHSLARFLSFMDFPLLLPLICEALRRLAIPVPNVSISIASSARAGRGR